MRVSCAVSKEIDEDVLHAHCTVPLDACKLRQSQTRTASIAVSRLRYVTRIIYSTWFAMRIQARTRLGIHMAASTSPPQFSQPTNRMEELIVSLSGYLCATHAADGPVSIRHVRMRFMVEDVKVVATNRKAGFEYFLLERFEAGLSLVGSEIKSIRAGQMSLAEAYVDVENGRSAWLLDCHIAPYAQASRFNHEPRRRRRLLLHKRQLRELWNAVRMKGMTIVPTRVYLKGGRAKIEIALARGKKAHDKRAVIARRDQAREHDRAARVR